MEDHTYPSAPQRAPERKPAASQRKCDEAKRKRDRRRQKTRINIGAAFWRWKSVMEGGGFQSDAEVACFLLDGLEGRPAAELLPGGTHRGGHVHEQAEATEEQVLDHSVDDMNVVEENAESALNDPMNSVIDWMDESWRREDGGETSDGAREDSQPPICLRMGGAGEKAPPTDRLPVIGVDETVHDPVCGQEVEFPEKQRQQVVPVKDDLIGARASIVYEEHLRQLLSFLVLPVDSCPGRRPGGETCGRGGPFEVRTRRTGTATSVEWVCPDGHQVWAWNSQPVTESGIQAGDFLLSANIVLSGSSYAKVSLLFNFMNMGMVDWKTFCSVQDGCCVDAIKELWEERRAAALRRLQGKDVVLLVAAEDGSRSDSSDHGNQSCSCAAMDKDTKEVVHVAVADKRRISSDPGRKDALLKMVERLTGEMKLVEICTDARGPMGALTSAEASRLEALGIHHSLDVWNVAQNLAGKISSAAKEEGQSVLLTWLKDIVNHFWWCCKTADSSHRFLALWVGIIHHVCNVHTWTMGSCQHAHLEDTAGKQWILKDSKCYKALVDIVLNKDWQKNIQKYLRFRSTEDLEAFEDHVMMYASRRVALSRPLLEARVLLAALDYNFHRNRPALRAADGRPIFRRLYRKSRRTYSVYALKSHKSYAYIPELQARILSGPARRSRRRPDVQETLTVGEEEEHDRVPEEDQEDLLDLPHIKEEQDWSPGEDQDSPTEPPTIKEEEEEQSPGEDHDSPMEAPHIKEEEEELWTSQEGQQLPGPEDADIKFTLVPVKSEDDEEKPQTSQLHHAHQMKTEADEEDRVGPEPAENRDPDGHAQAARHDKTSLSEPETDDSWDWEDTRERPQKKESSSDEDCPAGQSPAKWFSCSVCGKTYPRRNSLNDHMRLHSEGKRFSCSACKKSFQWRAGLERHMRIHTGEKPFTCYFCNLSFAQNSSLVSHVRVHTGEKPFKCSVCKVRFRVSSHLSKHMRLHSGDKPFVCSECGKRFAQRATLMRHSAVHTGEKPFSCSVCYKSFARQENLNRHYLALHTGRNRVNAAIDLM